jgi:serine/threonine protein kinase
LIIDAVTCGVHQRSVVMEQLGLSLGDIIEKKGKNFSLGQVVALGIQLITSIESLHNLGFVHCDIKPSNILVGLKKKN